MSVPAFWVHTFFFAKQNQHDHSEDKYGHWKRTGLFDFQDVLFEKGSPLKHLTIIVENWDFWGFHQDTLAGNLIWEEVAEELTGA